MDEQHEPQPTAEPKPYRVEVVVDAPYETVWAVLTEPDRIGEWFGWEYDGLADEIEHIFVAHAERFPPDRIALELGQELQVIADGERTIVRAVSPGALDGEQAGTYDVVEEGWRSFLEQLRYLLDRRPALPRRTVRLTGTASGQQLLAVLDGAGAKERWHDSTYQRMVVDADGRLLVAAAEAPLDSGETTPVSLVVNAYGLAGAERERLAGEWLERWRSGVPDGKEE
ncbi:activator of HSP90 ATPase [Micromonospora sp. WMMD882]|uniref:activator of HSP90 ATPase n=1 Tax=Micromonospora sp. WMMD882 TaxID=3015151 RepID=UPI00248CC91C|nr:activator of HSP90 ATPase [Micromonospora sp. WMMD882]WBB77552.1 activator of HSP90 ATPase [Micromonospora sp. WMMD882]